MSNENKFENSAEGDGDDSMSKEDDFVVRIRGLPWSSSKDDIVKFFSDCKIKDGINGIHMTMSREGRPSGNAYVEFESEEDVEKALKKDNQHIGQRYIEVFRCKKKEMKMALRRMGVDGEEGFNDACVRLRGLPFGCSKEEIAQFFSGLEIVRNGITLPTDFQGRSTGEAYVQFASQDIAEKAMGKHKEKIGHRYIEIFKSSLQEIRNATGMGPMRMRNMGGSNRFDPYERMDRPGPGGQYGMPRGRFGGFDNGFRRPEENFGGGPMFDAAVNYPVGPGGRNEPMGGFGGGDRFGPFGRSREPPSTGHRVHMRGLPYRAVEQDIFDFFKPQKPVSVRILYEPSGRSSGEADVEFFAHEEAVKAMKKDKEKIQHRYIELFLHSEAKPFRREMEPYGPDEGRPFGPGMDRQFGAGAERGFGPDAERRFEGGYGGGFPSDRPFGGPAPDRGFGSPPAGERQPYRSAGGERGYNMPSERPFGPATERFGSSERPFGPATERFGSSERPFGPTTERYGSSSERPFGPATERFGPPAEKQPYNAPADRYGSSTERPFGSTAGERFGPSGERPFMSGDRSYGASDDRPYGERNAPSGGDPNSMGYRNGMSQGYGGSTPGTFRNEGRFGGGLDMVHSGGGGGGGGLLPDFSYPSDIGSRTTWKRKERIGLRYIEIVKSSFHEIRSSTGMGPLRMRNVGFNRFDPYERIGRPGVPYGMMRSHYGGGRFEPMGGFGRDRFGPLGRGREPPTPSLGHHIHMRGLPFRAGEQEIYNFFKPLKPMSVRILYDTNGRSTGEAHVEFFTRDEALKAMKKDKEKIQHRYIELFLQSDSKPLLSLEDGRPLGLNVDRKFGPGGADRGFRPDAVRRYDGGHGGFLSGKRPFEGTAGERPYRPPFGERGYNMPPERPFGTTSERFGSSTSQRFGPLADKPYSVPSDRFGSSAEKPFGSANKRFGASGEHSFKLPENRSFGVRGVGSTGNLNSLGYNGVQQNYNSSNLSTFRSESRYGGGTGSQLRERSNFLSTGKTYTKSTYPLLAGHGGINSMIGGTNYHAF